MIYTLTTIYVFERPFSGVKSILRLGPLTKDVQISSRKFLAVTFLLSGTLAWFFLSFAWFDAFIGKIDAGSILLANALYFTSAGLSAVFALTISQKIERRLLLELWITIGVITTLSLAFIEGAFFAVLGSILLGFSFGFGYPASLAFLAEATVPEERARVAGSVFLIAFILVVFSQVILGILGASIIGAAVLCAILRLSSFAALACDPCKSEKVLSATKGSSIKRKNFISYTVPWIVFNLANGIAAFVTLAFYNNPDYTATLIVSSPIHFFAAGLFAFIGGIAADRYGRRQPVMVGLILLGNSFVLLGLFTSEATLFIYFLISGAAWGLLMTVYTAIPGDLSVSNNRQKYYAVATVIPLLIYMSLSTAANLMGISVAATIFSSLLSIILFASVIPVFLAAECLSAEKMEEREIQRHMKKVEELMKETNG